MVAEVALHAVGVVAGVAVVGCVAHLGGLGGEVKGGLRWVELVRGGGRFLWGRAGGWYRYRNVMALEVMFGCLGGLMMIHDGMSW